MLNSNNEMWRAILNHENQYEISNFGRVRSLRTNHNRARHLYRKCYIRSNTCKYLYVNLSKKNKSFTYAIHRLVAQAFIPNPQLKTMVNHIDGNKLNNNAYNLEWCTCSENHKHAYKLNLRNSTALQKRMIGTKYSTASKYHNVSWDRSRNKWIGSIKYNGKTLKNKRFNLEVDAANYVNWLIDTYNLDRPKNIIR